MSGDAKVEVGSSAYSDLYELMQQLADGRDFSSPSGLLKGVSLEKAELCLDGMPYSIADNLAHATRWQEEWLSKFEPRRTKEGEYKVGKEDWKPADPGEFDVLREKFIGGIDQAVEYAQRPELTDGDRVRLIRIALHAAYHLGQMNLLKRVS